MIDEMMREIAAALPETSQRGTKTIREVCLTYNSREWQVMAGGHSAVHIGEWGGDFHAWGNTAEDALDICLLIIKCKHP